jgi:hypothetical protein
MSAVGSSPEFSFSRFDFGNSCADDDIEITTIGRFSVMEDQSSPSLSLMKLRLANHEYLSLFLCLQIQVLGL